MVQKISIILCGVAMVLFSGCSSIEIEEGVSLSLAQERKSSISNIEYKLHFDIPSEISDSVVGEVEISFETVKAIPIVLDFRAKKSMVKSVMLKGKAIEYRFRNGHIIIPKKHVDAGINTYRVKFISNDGSLNRRNDFLYTLLVPDRASTVFPCFDQPDLKATFNLSLNIPSAWNALSNGAIHNVENVNEKIKHVQFANTKPISTYLFAFAVGNFGYVTRSVGGYEFTVYHRETDQQKLDRNLPILFDLHAQSLGWLEEYTGIKYPYEKLDFILIPGFQYSGMEHPGTIYYRDSRLLLDEHPSESQKLRQANLIAHEVAHQWFGNLVTMRWFNDVWLKEVFAGFMADQIVNPQYPSINHELSFMLSHFPSAYSVDRTKGANPIVQQLDNMLNAGTLYGDIIYHKAPIMMQQLVMLMGHEPFQRGVQDYLKSYQMGNASWSELVDILDKYTDINLKDWAQIWTERVGRPAAYYSLANNSNILRFEALNATPLPPMHIDICFGNKVEQTQQLWLQELPASIQVEPPADRPIALTVNSGGMAYGYFMPDSLTLIKMLQKGLFSANAVARAAQHLSLHEMLLDGHIDVDKYIRMVTACIKTETEPQIQNYLLNVLPNVFWRFTNQEIRDNLADSIEEMLWSMVNSKQPIEQRRAALSTLFSVFTSNESFSRLYSGWAQQKVCSIPLSENERTRLAYELMIRKPDLYHTIALGEIERINNPDRVAQFDFTLNAVSPNPSHRVDFFEKLADPANRKPEPWVAEALRWLHHPLRSDFGIRFIEPSLNMLPEIQRTGDIFFPKSWLDATLWGHSSPEALEVVESWLEANPNLSPNLKMKLLQSADMLYRANNRQSE